MAETYVSEPGSERRTNSGRDQRGVRVRTGQRGHPLGRRDLRRLPRPRRLVRGHRAHRPGDQGRRRTSRSSSWTPRRISPRRWPSSTRCGTRYGLNLTVTKPGPEAAAHPCGTEQCCQFRKVEPLRRALAGKRCLADVAQALRRADPRRRAHRELGRLLRTGEGQPAGDLDRRRHHVVPGRPRRCRCTRSSPGATAPSGVRRRRVPVAEGEDARAGRWSGLDKSECGLHV